MKLTVNVSVIHDATASSVPIQKIPSKIPVTLSADENKPHTNRLLYRQLLEKSNQRKTE